MALTATQQALLLFKKLMGKGSANPAFDFYEEPVNARPIVVPAQIWKQADLIPSTAPGASAGVVTKYVDQALTAIAGTANRAYSHANLIDAIPFNYGDGTSYNYTVKDSGGAAIPFGTGDWVVDPDAGTLTFYGTVPPNMPPTISFWKYSGTKGVGSGSAATVTGTRGSPTNVTAGAGITPAGVSDEVIFVQGNGGAAIDVTANPQIAAGATVGDKLEIIGRSDSATVLLENGTGLSLEGECLLQANVILGLRWDGTEWVERYRSR
jgi:hypothetical protein